MQRLLADWLADWENEMRKRMASKLHLLSVREVQTAHDGEHADGGGLMLRVSEASSVWVFRYTAPSGKRREMGLGIAHRSNAAQAGQSLTGAREQATHARALLQQGIDPIDERARLKEDAKRAVCEEREKRAAEAVTLARAARDYHERVIAPTRTDKHAAQWLSSLENHVPAAIWHKSIGQIRPPELLQALASMRPHERARNLNAGHRIAETVQRIRQRLDAVFEDAIFHELCSENPAAAVRRKLREVLPRKENRKLAALAYRDAPAFMARLRHVEGVAARALEFAILTAARTGEVIGAEWSEFDLDAAEWTVPAQRMKGKETHVVYLSPRALTALQGMRGMDERLVFPSPMRKGEPLSNMAMLTLLTRMGMRDRTTVHGLARATFSTWANETAAARPDVIEAPDQQDDSALRGGGSSHEPAA
jgi:integrase